MIVAAMRKTGSRGREKEKRLGLKEKKEGEPKIKH